jgi:hypothetical protein
MRIGRAPNASSLRERGEDFVVERLGNLVAVQSLNLGGALSVAAAAMPAKCTTVEAMTEAAAMEAMNLGTPVRMAVEAVSPGTPVRMAVEAVSPGTPVRMAVEAVNPGTPVRMAVEAVNAGTPVHAAVEAMNAGMPVRMAVEAVGPAPVRTAVKAIMPIMSMSPSGTVVSASIPTPIIGAIPRIIIRLAVVWRSNSNADTGDSKVDLSRCRGRGHCGGSDQAKSRDCVFDCTHRLARLCFVCHCVRWWTNAGS